LGKNSPYLVTLAGPCASAAQFRFENRKIFADAYSTKPSSRRSNGSFERHFFPIFLKREMDVDKDDNGQALLGQRFKTDPRNQVNLCAGLPDF
jgi:hypothetical protein